MMETSAAYVYGPEKEIKKDIERGVGREPEARPMKSTVQMEREMRSANKNRATRPKRNKARDRAKAKAASRQRRAA